MVYLTEWMGGAGGAGLNWLTSYYAPYDSGVLDVNEDQDGDGIPDRFDEDKDGNGVPDEEQDSDGDGVLDVYGTYCLLKSYCCILSHARGAGSP